MGIFFLIAGSVLFFAGLGCLLMVFVTIARRLKANWTTSIYFKGKSSRRTIVMTLIGIALIVCAQGFYWFYGEATRYIPFESNVPTAQVSFVYQQYVVIYDQERSAMQFVFESQVRHWRLLLLVLLGLILQ